MIGVIKLQYISIVIIFIAYFSSPQVTLACVVPTT